MPRKPMPIRELFINTGECSSGSGVAVWACRRCGWKLVDNATRFARHVLRCPSTQTGDRSLAKEHLASLGSTSAAQLEAISAAADEFGRAFTLEGRAQVRSLFEDTQVRRSGEKAKLFRCKRCGIETTENATRFAQHILKCQEATEEDKAIASNHQSLRAKRRETRQAKQGGVAAVVTVMTEIRDTDKPSVSRRSPPPSSSESSGNGRRVTESSTGTWNNGSVEKVVSEGARRASISPSRSGPFPVEVLHADLEVQAPPLIDEEVSVGGVLSASAAAANLESPCSLLPIESASLPPSTHADPLLRMDSQDIMNLDLLDYFAQGSFEEELAKLQQPVVSDPESQPGCTGDYVNAPGAPTLQLQIETASDLNVFFYPPSIPDYSASHSCAQMATDVCNDDRPFSQLYHRPPAAPSAHLGDNACTPPSHQQSSRGHFDSHLTYQNFYPHQGFTQQASNAGVSIVEVGSRISPSGTLHSSMGTVQGAHDNDCTAVAPVFQKRQRDVNGQSQPAETVSISLQEYQEWKQWKEQIERPTIIQVPDMEYTMFQNLYSFMLSHAMNCTKTYMAHKGLIGPSCNTEMIGRAISKEWTSLASVYRTMVTCCAKAQARFVLDKAGTCPERVAGICDSALAIAQDCLSSGIAGALHKWSQFSNLDRYQLAAYQGLDKAFRHMTLNDDGTDHTMDSKSEGFMIGLQQAAVTHGPYLRDLYLGNSNSNQLTASNSDSQNHGRVPSQRAPNMGVPCHDRATISHGDFTDWHQLATEMSPIMDEIGEDVRMSVAMTSYMTEIYSVVGWDLMLVV